MKRLALTLLVVFVLAGCGGGDAEAEAIASRTPTGTEEAQQSFEGFLSNPFINDEQREQSKDMVWRACAAMQDGATWQEVEDQELAALAESGRALSDLELSGLRTGATLGISAYCPQHVDRAP
jgi:hypothetical protein